MKKTNIVLFSSGVTEGSGLLGAIKNNLEKKDYSCSDWRDLFTLARRADQIALLPMLIKKIPTFDYAVLICEGHDRVSIARNGEKIEYNAMRDNVLFEIGLCCMALGLQKVILVTDGTVHLPDDLVGAGLKIAIKYIPHAQTDVLPWTDEMALKITEPIDEYIKGSKTALSPVVIGAAASTACGYINNFVSRTLERIDTGIILDKGEKEYYPLDRIYMHVVMPRVLDNGEIKQDARARKYPQGSVPDARARSANFCYKIEDGNLHIYDFPTTITTSYDIAKMILEIDADDEADVKAKLRFVEKEIALFETTLKSLFNRTYFYNAIKELCKYENPSEEDLQRYTENVASITMNRFVLEYAQDE